MSSNWKGIIWDKLKNQEQLPEWFNEPNKSNMEELTEDERRELEAIKNGTYRA